jgi:SpoVK/Ycf46/Vps4 family AAA+-type ATPase
VATARDMASQRGDTIQGTDLFAAARTHSNPRLSALARKIVARYCWQDIVLPDDQITLLREIVATIRGRPKVLEEWGVVRKLASSAGVTVLFAGPPGTGKTMAAEVIASELGLDLYKIDLSTVVSKYIGETEKNLERIFGEAQNSNAILFFDEADAIFGKRSEVKDAHDRYANIEISYLLQRMEAYDGVTILATNLRANLDEAFTRRLQFAVDFPFPEEEYRLRIWQTLFPSTVPRTDDLDFALLAHRFKLAGGSIRNVIVNAAFLAAAEGEPVAMRHLLHATRRELQKMGRLVSEADMATG